MSRLTHHCYFSYASERAGCLHTLYIKCIVYSWSCCRTILCCTSRRGNRVAFDCKATWWLLTRVTICWRQSVTFTALKSQELRWYIL